MARLQNLRIHPHHLLKHCVSVNDSVCVDGKILNDIYVMPEEIETERSLLFLVVRLAVS